MRAVRGGGWTRAACAPERVRRALGLFSGARELEVSGAKRGGLPPECPPLPALRALTLDACTLDKKPLLAIARAAPGLESLSLARSPKGGALTLGGMRAVFSALSSLKSLTTRFYFRVNTDECLFVPQAMDKLPASLTHLDLSRSDVGFHCDCFAHLSALATLTLARCRELRGLETLGNLPALRKVDLYGCREFGAAAARALGRAGELRALRLASCALVDAGAARAGAALRAAGTGRGYARGWTPRPCSRCATSPGCGTWT